MKLVSFDLEYNPSTKKIDQFGYWASDGSSLRTRNLHQLLTVLNDADILLGHNVLYHDLEVLATQFGYESTTDQIIDTLLLSTLLFIEKPYHKLTKNYLSRLKLEEVYDPKLDSKIVLEQLLPELQAKWVKLPDIQKSLYYHLLKNELGFNGFFKLIRFGTDSTLQEDLSRLDKSSFCISVDLSANLLQSLAC